jgi:hypothetical protein
MNVEKIKRKMSEGYTDADIANMSGMSIEDVAKLRAPAPKKEAPAAVVTKKPVGEKKKK